MSSAPALALLIVITGTLLGLGTKWGLLRYWWVIVKLVISLLVFSAVLSVVKPWGRRD